MNDSGENFVPVVSVAERLPLRQRIAEFAGNYSVRVAGIVGLAVLAGGLAANNESEETIDAGWHAVPAVTVGCDGVGEATLENPDEDWNTGEALLEITNTSKQPDEVVSGKFDPGQHISLVVKSGDVIDFLADWDDTDEAPFKDTLVVPEPENCETTTLPTETTEPEETTSTTVVATTTTGSPTTSSSSIPEQSTTSTSSIPEQSTTTTPAQETTTTSTYPPVHVTTTTIAPPPSIPATEEFRVGRSAGQTSEEQFSFAA